MTLKNGTTKSSRPVTNGKRKYPTPWSVRQSLSALCPPLSWHHYIRGKELPPLFKKAKENGTKIIPLMVSPCGVFEDSWLSKYQAAGNPQETLSECTDAEAERRLANLMRDLKELIK